MFKWTQKGDISEHLFEIGFSYTRKKYWKFIFQFFQKHIIIRTIQVRSIVIWVAEKFCRIVLENHIADVYIENKRTSYRPLWNTKQNI